MSRWIDHSDLAAHIRLGCSWYGESDEECVNSSCELRKYEHDPTSAMEITERDDPQCDGSGIKKNKRTFASLQRKK